MKLIDCIPIGKENKETRETLMSKTEMTSVKQFKKELQKLRKKYIIIFDEEGYYIPANKEEYYKFIQKLNGQAYEINKTIDLTYKNMEELTKKE